MGTRVLVFSKTAGFRHDSIPEGIAAVRELGRGRRLRRRRHRGRRRLHRRATSPGTTPSSSSPPPGDVLNAAQQTRLRAATSSSGGGYVGIHAAADTEYDWAFYGGLAGAYFQSHPAIQPATVERRGPGTPGDLAPRPGLEPHRRVVQLPLQPARARPRPGLARRVVVHRRHDERRPSDRLVPGVPGRPRLLHRRRPHQGVVRRTRLPAAPAGRHPVRRRRRPGRLPPGERLPAALRRHRRVAVGVAAGGAGLVLADRRRHAHVERRPGDALVRGLRSGPASVRTR